MKKLLSVVLACAMIFTMVLPMAVFAESAVTISTAEAVTIELDNYVVTNTANFKRSAKSLASGGYALVGNRSVSGATSVTVASVDVTVANAGFYDLEYEATNYTSVSNSSLFSRIEYYLTPVVGEGETATARKIATTANQNVIGQKPDFVVATMRVDKFCDKSYIAAGEYTLTAVVTVVGGTARGSVDYIKFSASANPQVSKSAGVTIEFDEIETTGVGKVKKSTSTSDDYLQISTTSTPNFVSSINVTETGYYDIEYVVGTVGSAGTNYISNIALALGDISIGKNPKNTDQELAYDIDSTISANYGNMYKYVKQRVKLEADTYDLDVAITPAPQRDGKYWCIMDNIKITPIAHAQLSDTAPLTLEFDEIEATGVGTVETSTSTSDDYLKISTTSAPEFVSTIDVAETGYYDIEYVVGTVGNAGTDYISNIALTLGDISIGKNSKNTDQELAYEIDNTIATNYGKMYKYVKQRVPIEAGTYDLGVAITPAPQRDKYWCIMDYIKFTPSEEEVILPNEATTIAFDGETNNVVVTSALNEGTAKVIWVAYDANDKMTSYAISAAFDLVNVGTIPVVVPGTFNAASGTKMKAMLWVDEVNCKPLTAFINK